MEGNTGTGLLRELPVFIEESDEIVTLILTEEDAARASRDQIYLKSLIEADRSKNSSVAEERDSSEETPNYDTEISNGISWSEAAVFLFLEIYRKMEIEFTKNKRHNKIWAQIASEMNTNNSSYNITGQQCSSKMSGLKRTYKNIRDQNKKSGNIKNTWAFYSVMDSLFGEKAYISPPAVASSEGPSPPHLDSNCASSRLGPSTSTSNDYMDTKPPEKKRRVEIILKNYIEDMKLEREQMKCEREKEKNRREEEKRMQDNEKKEDKRRMHEEKMEVQKSMIDLLKCLVTDHKK